MVTRDEAIKVLEKLKCNKPEMMARRVQASEKGIGFVLGYIFDHPNSYALSISESMRISRARVTVILKKLEERGLIKKTPSPSDARIEVLTVTKKGEKEVNACKEQAINMVMTIIDRVGYEEINTFIETSLKIRKVLLGLDKSGTSPKCKTYNIDKKEANNV